MNPVEKMLNELVDAGELAGAATLAWHNGTASVVTAGRRNWDMDAPVERDTIFRIASMTKPVTTVAALMLYDEGRFELDEPITSCAPELAQMRVLRNPNGRHDLRARQRWSVVNCR